MLVVIFIIYISQSTFFSFSCFFSSSSLSELLFRCFFFFFFFFFFSSFSFSWCIWHRGLKHSVIKQKQSFSANFKVLFQVFKNSGLTSMRVWGFFTDSSPVASFTIHSSEFCGKIYAIGLEYHSYQLCKLKCEAWGYMFHTDSDLRRWLSYSSKNRRTITHSDLLPSFSSTVGILDKRVTAFVSPSAFFPVRSPDMLQREKERLLKMEPEPRMVWLNGLSTGLRSKRSLVWFSARAHACVVGQIPGWGYTRGNRCIYCTSMFLLLFPLQR